jgi:uncharacterized RDD family membrane protein YckC
VWCDGMTDWLAADTVVGLIPVLQSAPPRKVQPTLNYGVGDSAYRQDLPEVQYAGFGIRFGAWLIDLIVWFVASGVLNGIFYLMDGDRDQVIRLLGDLSRIIGPWLYFSLMYSSASQASLGMMAVGIQVTDLNGQRVTFGRATGRYFASWLSAITLGIGYLMILWSPRRQVLHDLIAGRLVLM